MEMNETRAFKSLRNVMIVGVIMTTFCVMAMGLLIYTKIAGGQNVTAGDSTLMNILMAVLMVYIIIALGMSYGVYKKRNLPCAVLLFIFDLAIFIYMIISGTTKVLLSNVVIHLIFLVVFLQGIRACLYFKQEKNNRVI